MNFRKTLFYLLILFPIFGYGQFIQSSVNVSRTLAIHPDFPVIKSNKPSFNLTYVLKAKGKKSYWPQIYNYPSIYFSLDYQSAGTAVLGDLIGIGPFVGIPISNHKKESVTLVTGLGLGVATNPFNKITNPSNIVIGSTFSIYAKASLQYRIALTDHIDFLSNISIHHYSNGNFVSPNIGANLLATGIGLGIKLSNEQVEIKPHQLDSLFKFSTGPWKPFLRLGLGLKEQGIDGPKYPIYVLGLGIKKRTSRKDIFITGFEYLINYADVRFLKSTFGFEGEEIQKASRLLAFVGHEFVYKHFSFITELGYYFTDHYDKRSSFSSKLGLAFNLNKPHAISNLQTGFYVRAKLLEAEFLEWNINFSF